MKSLAEQGKEMIENLAPEEIDSYTTYRKPEESSGETSKRPEIFEKMAKSAEMGRKAARENHGSNGTDASFVKASEIGTVEKVQQILIKTQEHFRTHVQAVDDKLTEFGQKLRDSIFGS